MTCYKGAKYSGDFKQINFMNLKKCLDDLPGLDVKKSRGFGRGGGSPLPRLDEVAEAKFAGPVKFM